MSVDWDYLLAWMLHPTQAAILGAMEWIQEPLSPLDITRIMERRESLQSVAYHVRRLRDIGMLRAVGTEPRRGATEHFYTLAN